MTDPADIDIRPWADADREAVLALLERSLRWTVDERHAAFLDWKHRESPFGPSPAWVAVAGDRVVGFRAFSRWRFRQGDRVVDAVRAVDTATDPDLARRGIFSRLTEHAVEALRADGVAFVFNTPNEQSRPGYLKMGWVVVGRVPTRARPRLHPRALSALRGTGPASKWAEGVSVGLPVHEVLSDREPVARLLGDLPQEPDLVTDRSAEFLAWRYGFEPLGYRVLLAGDSPEEGLAVFRLRPRGRGWVAVVCELLLPMDGRGHAKTLLRQVGRATEADVVVIAGHQAPARHGFLPVPGAGPVLTWRHLNQEIPPQLAEWKVTLGDVELF